MHSSPVQKFFGERFSQLKGGASWITTVLRTLGGLSLLRLFRDAFFSSIAIPGARLLGVSSEIYLPSLLAFLQISSSAGVGHVGGGLEACLLACLAVAFI